MTASTILRTAFTAAATGAVLLTSFTVAGAASAAPAPKTTTTTTTTTTVPVSSAVLKSPRLTETLGRKIG